MSSFFGQPLPHEHALVPSPSLAPMQPAGHLPVSLQHPYLASAECPWYVQGTCVGAGVGGGVGTGIGVGKGAVGDPVVGGTDGLIVGNVVGFEVTMVISCTNSDRSSSS